MHLLQLLKKFFQEFLFGISQKKSIETVFNKFVQEFLKDFLKIFINGTFPGYFLTDFRRCFQRFFQKFINFLQKFRDFCKTFLKNIIGISYWNSIRHYFMHLRILASISFDVSLENFQIIVLEFAPGFLQKFFQKLLMIYSNISTGIL